MAHDIFRMAPQTALPPLPEGFSNGIVPSLKCDQITAGTPMWGQ